MEIKESQIMPKISSMITFISQQAKQDLVNAKNKGMFELSEKELTKVCNIIESSIMQNFIKSSSEVTSLFK